VERRDEGAGVLIVSTELDEVLALGDRIAVMYHGRIVAILDPAEATPERLGLYMGGALSDAGALGPATGSSTLPDGAPPPPVAGSSEASVGGTAR
jgi:simple sugar transport system ATP-binding protein